MAISVPHTDGLLRPELTSVFLQVTSAIRSPRSVSSRSRVVECLLSCANHQDRFWPLCRTLHNGHTPFRGGSSQAAPELTGPKTGSASPGCHWTAMNGRCRSRALQAATDCGQARFTKYVHPVWSVLDFSRRAERREASRPCSRGSLPPAGGRESWKRFLRLPPHAARNLWKDDSMSVAPRHGFRCRGGFHVESRPSCSARGGARRPRRRRCAAGIGADRSTCRGRVLSMHQGKPQGRQAGAMDRGSLYPKASAISLPP